MTARIAIDTGGTFTDFVLFDEGSEELCFHKTPSTPDDPSRSLVEGIVTILENTDHSPAEIELLIHGTTVATNAVLQRKGARAAFVTTAGFRDVLHIQRQDRPHMYDLRSRRAEALVPRALRCEVEERILHDGTIEIPWTRSSSTRSPEHWQSAMSRRSPSGSCTASPIPLTSCGRGSSSPGDCRKRHSVSRASSSSKRVSTNASAPAP